LKDFSVTAFLALVKAEGKALGVLGVFFAGFLVGAFLVAGLAFLTGFLEGNGAVLDLGCDLDALGVFQIKLWVALGAGEAIGRFFVLGAIRD
jgi:hypothetical protein